MDFPLDSGEVKHLCFLANYHTNHLCICKESWNLSLWKWIASGLGGGKKANFDSCSKTPAHKSPVR